MRSRALRALAIGAVLALNACAPSAADEAAALAARPAKVCVSAGTRCVLPSDALGICHAPHGAPQGAPLVCVSQH